MIGLKRNVPVAIVLLVVGGVLMFVWQTSRPPTPIGPIQPGPLVSPADTEFARGLEALAEDDFDEAFARFSAAIRLNPEQADGYYYRGGIFFSRSEWKKAFDDFSDAIRLDPEHSRALFARATIHSRRQNYDWALADLAEALRLQPENAFFLNNRAFVYRQLHDYELAVADYEAAMKLLPDHDAPLGGLAWVLATCPEESLRDGPRAVELATRACELTNWKDRIALETLAAACAECQDYETAVDRQQQALQLIQNDPDRIAAARERLAQYEQHQPFRDAVIEQAGG
ncbi:MAG: tetratricopeptide repeat protein [Planctomycetes bacterium]|nr:tetratricopeptide repeat protein [Planctomycetota bacterium]